MGRDEQINKIGRIAVGIVAEQDTKLKFPDRGHYNYECLESAIGKALADKGIRDKDGFEVGYKNEGSTGDYVEWRKRTTLVRLKDHDKNK